MLTFWKTNLIHFEYEDAGKQEDIEVGGMQENLQEKKKNKPERSF